MNKFREIREDSVVLQIVIALISKATSIQKFSRHGNKEQMCLILILMIPYH